MKQFVFTGFFIFYSYCFPVPLSAQEKTPAQDEPAQISLEQKEAFFQAARDGDVTRVNELLESGVPVDVRSPYNATALMFASSKGQIEVVRVLLEAGADANAKDNFYSAGPMAWAAMKQQKDVAMLLLESGAKGADSALLLMVMGKDEAGAEKILEEYEPSKSALQRAKKALPADASEALKALFAEVEIPEPSKESKGWSPSSLDLEKYTGQFIQRPEAESDSEQESLASAATEDPSKLTGLLTITLDGSELRLAKDVSSATLKPAEKPNEFTMLDVSIRFLLEDDRVVALEMDREDQEAASKYVRFKLPAKSKVSSARSLAQDREISSANWLQFRGYGARGVAEGQNPPIAWDVPSGKNVLWKIPVEGLAHSCPIIVDDQLILTTAVGGENDPGLKTGLYGDVDSVEDESEHRFEVHCYDKHSGELRWKQVACTAVPQVKRHLKGTHANSTPVTDGEYVVAFFGSEGLYCYRLADGELVWQRDFGKLDSGWFFDSSYQWGFASSPILYDNKVFVQCDIQQGSFIAALDLETGNDLWRTEREEIPSWSTPTIVETSSGTQLISNATNYARAYDPQDGKELWRIGKNSEIVVPTPFTAHDLIYVASGYRPIKPILAIRPDSIGDISLEKDQKSSESIVWSNKRSGPYMVTPVCYGDYLYTCGSSGIFQCLEAKTGKQVYRRRIATSDAKSFVASLLAGDGHIYVPAEEGNMLVIRAGEEYELVAENPLGESLLSTPAISDGVMYLRGAKHLVAVGKSGE